jgi:hypothetical protein
VKPIAGIDMTPSGVCRVVWEITICTTFVAVRSLTPRALAVVAKGEIWLTPHRSAVVTMRATLFVLD